MVKQQITERLPLNDGYTIPIIGFGTSGIANRDAEEVVFNAIMKGYRLIDTAKIYDNEEGVGRGIQKQSTREFHGMNFSSCRKFGNQIWVLNRRRKLSMKRMSV